MNIQHGINQLLTVSGTAVGFNKQFERQKVQDTKAGIAALEAATKLDEQLKGSQAELKQAQADKASMEKGQAKNAQTLSDYQNRHANPTSGQQSYITRLARAEESFKNKILEQVNVINNKELAIQLAKKKMALNQEVIDKTKIMDKLGGGK